MSTVPINKHVVFKILLTPPLKKYAIFYGILDLSKILCNNKANVKIIFCVQLKQTKHLPRSQPQSIVNDLIS